MSLVFTILIILHVVVCLFLVLLVMLQNDKGGGLAGAFGGMGGGAAFSGSSTATFLTKLTWYFCLGFFLLIMGMGVVGTKRSASRMGESELKGATKWMSNALPGSAPNTGAIPGLGSGSQAAPAIPGLPAQPAKTP
jgi:preprotein translocase subunit SecG